MHVYYERLRVRFAPYWTPLNPTGIHILTGRGIFQFLGIRFLTEWHKLSVHCCHFNINGWNVHCVFSLLAEKCTLPCLKKDAHRTYRNILSLRISILKFTSLIWLKSTQNLQGAELITQQQANSNKITPLYSHANTQFCICFISLRNQD